MTRQRTAPTPRRTVGIGQRPPFRWTCPACGQTVITLVAVSAAPTCSAHAGGGRSMDATRIRFRDVTDGERTVDER